MALNRPDGSDLIAALREFLDSDVAPQVDDATRFKLRIAANVLGIIERELTLRGPADAAELAGVSALLGEGAAGCGLADLNRILAGRIRAGAFDAPAARRQLLAHLKAATAAKLAIDNPRYT